MGASLKPANIKVLNETERRAKGGIDVGLREKYAEVWLPNRDEVMRRCSMAHSHPDEDGLPLGDVIWKKLVDEFQIAERLDPDLMGEYEGGPEDIFNHMMRTCGERRPASLDVVRTAMEKPAKPPDTGGSQGTLGGEGLIVDYLPRGAKRPEPSKSPEPPEGTTLPPVAGLHFTDVVDRETVAGWGSIFVTLRDIATTTVRLTVDQKSENEFSVHLDMTGKIPGEVASSIRDSVSDNGTYSEDESW